MVLCWLWKIYMEEANFFFFHRIAPHSNQSNGERGNEKISHWGPLAPGVEDSKIWLFISWRACPVFDYNVWTWRFLPTHVGLYSSIMVVEKLWNCSESRLVICKIRLHGGGSKRIWGQISTHRLAQKQACLSLLVGSFHPSFIHSEKTGMWSSWEVFKSIVWCASWPLVCTDAAEWCPSHFGLSQTLPTGDISLSPL